MRIPLFIVDAFTEKVFSGNPAAICFMEHWMEDGVLQNIAAENNLPETAFLVRQDGYYDLRWFSPTVEIDLCGHATLASAFAIFTFFDTAAQSIAFKTASGVLQVKQDQGLISMDFPARKPTPSASTSLICEALGITPQEVYESRDLLAILADENQVRLLKPDLAKISRIENVLGVIVSARGDTVDFVSRFFAPRAGIPEDPVTGSAHCTLVPFWAGRLGKTRLHARQLSQRGGDLYCEDRGERVMISGRAVLYSQGEINIPES
jgi:PhzF family phenazine biosynthesis protein